MKGEVKGTSAWYRETLGEEGRKGERKARIGKVCVSVETER